MWDTINFRASKLGRDTSSLALIRRFPSTFPFSTDSSTCRKFFTTRSRTSIVSQGAIRCGYCRLSNLPAAISPILSEFEHYLRRTSVRSPESNELDKLCERRDRERQSVEGGTREISPIQFSYGPQESHRI